MSILNTIRMKDKINKIKTRLLEFDKDKSWIFRVVKYTGRIDRIITDTIIKKQKLSIQTM
jgi:hypothetical protein